MKDERGEQAKRLRANAPRGKRGLRGKRGIVGKMGKMGKMGIVGKLPIVPKIPIVPRKKSLVPLVPLVPLSDSWRSNGAQPPHTNKKNGRLSPSVSRAQDKTRTCTS